MWVTVLTSGVMRVMDSLNVSLQQLCTVLTDALIAGSSSMSETLPGAAVAAITINISFFWPVCSAEEGNH